MKHKCQSFLPFCDRRDSSEYSAFVKYYHWRYKLFLSFTFLGIFFDSKLLFPPHPPLKGILVSSMLENMTMEWIEYKLGLSFKNPFSHGNFIMWYLLAELLIFRGFLLTGWRKGLHVHCMGGSGNRQFTQKAAITVSSRVKNPKSYSYIL